MSETDVAAVVIGRHTEEPLVEGGGIIARLLTRAFNEMGIPTYLLAVNYENPEAVKIKAFERGIRSEVIFKIRFLSQDDVLNTLQGMMLSNLVETIITPNLTLKLLKKLKENYRHVFVFVVNASKIASNILTDLIKLSSSRIIKVYVLSRREELYRHTFRLLKPDMILATSKELQLLALKSFNMNADKVFFAYPPVGEGTIRNIMVKEPLLLYLGRVNESRFPLDYFKNIALKLKESPKDFKLIVAFPPEKLSISWSLKAISIVRKLEISNCVVLIPRILNSTEKRLLSERSSIFIYPAKKTGAIEPPLSVLEAMSHGQYLITTGNSSTRELVIQTAGCICEDFSKLKTLEEYYIESKQASNIILEWFRKNLSFKAFVRVLESIITTCFEYS